MNFYKRNNQIIHHVHIPKCAGTTIHTMLTSEGWEFILPEGSPVKPGEPKKLIKRNHFSAKIWKKWNVFSETEFEFALVRNPIDRILSQAKQELVHEHDLASEFVGKMTGGWMPRDEEFIYRFYEDEGIFTEDTNIRNFSINEIANVIQSANLRRDSWTHRLVVKNWINSSFKRKTGRLPSKLDFINWIFNRYSKMPDRYSTAWNLIGYQNCISEKTTIYRQEDEFKKLMLDLKERNIIQNIDDIPRENKSKFDFSYAPYSWDNFPNLKDEILKIYSKDFELYKYNLEESLSADSSQDFRHYDEPMRSDDIVEFIKVPTK